MAMRLMTPTEAQKSRALTQHHDIVRLQELQDMIRRKNAELAGTEAAFQELLLSQRTRWAKEEAEALAHMEALRAEVKQLQEEVQKARFPAEIVNARAQLVLTEARAQLEQAQEIQRENEGLTEVLEARIASADQAKETWEQKLASLDSRETAVRRQEDETQQHAEMLTERMSTFLAHKTATEEDLAKRANELQERLVGIELREQLIEDKIKEIARREEAVMILEYKYNSPVKKL